ncbi:hypothetical protein Lalb_Chr18g0051071 [Lupinus albus]|uniref:Uncharacterized protein n=1 Tax=Lupinus albus TaxID=3870 RepID=A0A6A4NYC9_LUPAL|nr:hypothetical protein Lalb_Chr18g0051071 [Lupinus albus]
MSNLVFKPSLDLLGIFSKVPKRLSNTFFSICITSIKCLTYNELQYDNSKKIDFFFHPQTVTIFVAKGLPKLLFKPISFSPSTILMICMKKSTVTKVDILLIVWQPR